MANENSSGAAPSARKTIADIIAEKRELADALESATSRDRTAEQQETIDDLRTDANRIEAAWRLEREELERYATSKMLDGATIVDNRGNAAAVREALVVLTDKVLDYLHKGLIQLPLPLENATAKARAALTLPPRQCDIGTAEEQEERYLKLKREHVDRMARCPAVGHSFFFPDSLYWAQMPYEEEGTAQ